MHFYLHVVSCQRKDVGVLSHSSEGKKERLCLDVPCFRLDTLCQMCRCGQDLAHHSLRAIGNAGNFTRCSEMRFCSSDTGTCT